MSFDWRKLPDDLIAALPVRPASAQSHLKKQKHRKDCKQQRSDSKRPNLTKSRTVASEDEEQRPPFTFNNCHFHLDKSQKTSNTKNPEVAIDPNTLTTLMERIKKEKLIEPTEVFVANQKYSAAMSISEFNPPANALWEGENTFPSSHEAPSSFKGFLQQSLKENTQSHAEEQEIMQKEAEMFRSVHQELCDLSNDLKLKNEKIQQDAKNLEKQRQSLQAEQSALLVQEKRLKKDVQLMVASAIKQKEKQMKDVLLFH